MGVREPGKERQSYSLSSFIIAGWYMHFVRGSYTGFNAMRMQAATEKARNETILKVGP